jgi:hypothetical protein
MAEPSKADWPWLILHNDHPAWYQRALLPGDFAPGRMPMPNYILTLTGEIPKLGQVRCGTCKKKPAVEDLEPVERTTGQTGFLDRYRYGRRPVPWPEGLNPTNCWNCNNPMGNDSKEIDCDATLLRKVKEQKGYKVRVCKGCAEHLKLNISRKETLHGLDNA